MWPRVLATILYVQGISYGRYCFAYAIDITIENLT